MIIAKRLVGRPPDARLYRMTQKEVAIEMRTSRQRVAEIEKRALAKVAAFILKGQP
jgi:predicted DNA-binding protein (UPF0251 family)